MNATAAFGTSNQSVTLSATATSPAGTVNSGTAMFTVFNSSNVQVGSAVTSATVSSGAASANFIVPGGTVLGMYTITAAYSGSSDYISSSGTNTLNVACPPNDPVVTVNPQPLTLNVGDTAIFTAAATTLSPPLTAQWQVSTDGGVSFSNIPGGVSTTIPNGISSILSFTVQAGMNGNRYKAVFTSGCGMTPTDPPLGIPLGVPGDTFQVQYFSNLNFGDSVINITNTGASATATLTNPTVAQNNINGNIYVNMYAFAADEQEVGCCSCLVTPNALWSASVKTAVLNSVLTPSVPNEVVVKLLASVPAQDNKGNQTCNPATVGASGTVINTTPGAASNGLQAWGTTLHATPTIPISYAVAEGPFLRGAVNAAELQRDVQECQFIQILGSGQFGICKGCSNVGLGAAAE